MSGFAADLVQGFYPSFSAVNISSAMMGATLLWCRLGVHETRAWKFKELWMLLGVPERKAQILGVVTFVVFGSLTGLLISAPQGGINGARQAFAAGLGWTGFAASMQRGSLKDNKHRRGGT